MAWISRSLAIVTCVGMSFFSTGTALGEPSVDARARVVLDELVRLVETDTTAARGWRVVAIEAHRQGNRDLAQRAIVRFAQTTKKEGDLLTVLNEAADEGEADAVEAALSATSVKLSMYPEDGNLLLAIALVNAGRFEEAWAVAEQSEKKLYPLMFGGIAKAYAVKGQAVWFEKAIEHLPWVPAPRSDSSPKRVPRDRVAAILDSIYDLATHGHVERIAALVEQIPDENQRRAGRLETAFAALAAGKDMHALRTLKDLGLVGPEVDALGRFVDRRWISTATAQSARKPKSTRQWEIACSIADYWPSPTPAWRALLVSGAEFLAKQPSEVLTRYLLQPLDRVPPESAWEDVATVAGGFLRGGRLSEAEAVLRRADKVVGLKLRDDRYGLGRYGVNRADLDMRQRLAGLALHLERLDIARSLLEPIMATPIESPLWHELTWRLVAEGKIDEAYSIVKHSDTARLELASLVGLANGLAKRGQRQEALLLQQAIEPRLLALDKSSMTWVIAAAETYELLGDRQRSDRLWNHAAATMGNDGGYDRVRLAYSRLLAGRVADVEAAFDGISEADEQYEALRLLVYEQARLGQVAHVKSVLALIASRRTDENEVADVRLNAAIRLAAAEQVSEAIGIAQSVRDGNAQRYVLEQMIWAVRFGVRTGSNCAHINNADR